MIPQQVIGLKLTIDTLSLSVAFVRYFMNRKKSHNLQEILCHAFLFATFAADLTATGIFIWIMVQEKNLRIKYNNDMSIVDQYLVTSKNSQVRIACPMLKNSFLLEHTISVKIPAFIPAFAVAFAVAFALPSQLHKPVFNISLDPKW